MSDSMNHEGVYRAAPATPGLLNIRGTQGQKCRIPPYRKYIFRFFEKLKVPEYYRKSENFRLQREI